MDGLVCVEEDLVVNAIFHGKPVELVEDRGDVAADGGSSDFVGETKE